MNLWLASWAGLICTTSSAIHDNIASWVSDRICGWLRVLDAGVSVGSPLGVLRRADVCGVGLRGHWVVTDSSS